MKLRIFSGALLISLLLCRPAPAAPLFNETRSFQQPDGSEVRLVLNGDEFYLRAETLDGFTVVRDPATGWICYAAVSADGTQLVSTGVPCEGIAEPAGARRLRAGRLVPQERHLEVSGPARQRQAQTARTALWGEHQELVTRGAALRQPATASVTPARTAQPADASQTDAGSILPPRSSEVAKYTGTVRGIILVVDFPDAPAGTSPTFQDYVNSINKPNFHKSDGRANSLRTFFEDVSRGAFIVSNYVFGIYRAPETFAYYDNLGYGTGAQLLMSNALQQVAASGFDFSQLTVDSSGNVKDLAIMYTGSPKTWAQGMWFHSGWWGNGPTYNGVRFRQYCTTSATTDPGTLTHEHGHLIAGWPDMYSYQGAETGVWDMMGGGRADLPNPYLLYLNGWLNATNVLGNYGFKTMSSVNAGAALVHYDPAQPREFFFIRPYTRSLLYCPNIPEEGLSLWRINLDGDNAAYPNKPLLVEMVHANGVVANASANVLFKSTGHNSFTDTTSPGSDWLYHAHKDQRSGLNLTEISAPGATMSFRLSRPIYFYPLPTQVSGVGTPVSLTVTAVSDQALTYSAAGLPPGLYIYPATGLIAGTPTTVGGYNVTVTARSTDGSQNPYSFYWVVGNGAPYTPIAWLPFNGNAQDASGRGYHGTLVGSPVFTNNTIAFNGTNTAVMITRPISYDFTIAFFMKTSLPGSSGSQWYNGSGLVDGEVAGATHDFGVSLTGEQVAFGVGSPNGDTTIQSLGKVADGRWHHVAVTRKAATGAMALYIDGALDVSGTGPTGAKTAPAALRIGCLQTANNFFNGAIDEVRLYTSAISAEEILNLSTRRLEVLPIADQVTPLGANCSLQVQVAHQTNVLFSASGLPAGLTLDPTNGVISGAPTSSGVYSVAVLATSSEGPESTAAFAWHVSSSSFLTTPVAYYPFQDNANDLYTGAYNGQLLGNPSFPSEGISFDGVDDAVKITRSVYADFTISFFINTGAEGANASQWYSGLGLVDGEVSGATHDFGVSLLASHIAFGVGSPGGDTTIQSIRSVNDRTWHHVAVTRRSQTGAMAIYVDGLLDKTGTGPTGNKTSPPALRVGSLQTGINFFPGSIAQLRLYTSALTADEIFRLSRRMAPAQGYRIVRSQFGLQSDDTLTWHGIPGETYQVERAQDLSQAFLPVGAPVSAGTLNLLTNSVPAAPDGAFYRIRKL